MVTSAQRLCVVGLLFFVSPCLALPWSHEPEPLPNFYAGEVWELLQGFLDPHTILIGMLQIPIRLLHLKKVTWTRCHHHQLLSTCACACVRSIYLWRKYVARYLGYVELRRQRSLYTSGEDVLIRLPMSRLNETKQLLSNNVSTYFVDLR